MLPLSDSFETKDVSIHAPARGAMSTMKDPTTACLVSIHAPARGAMESRLKRDATAGFNSRTREGCDDGTDLVAFLWIVSIHAPARGAM